jgi:hypothetical protein
MYKKINLPIFMVLVFAAFVLTLQSFSITAATNLKSGAVYVLTNQVTNAVAAYDRAVNGA